MTAALDAYKAAMATARAVFDAPQAADDYRAAFAAYESYCDLGAAASLAYDLAYQTETAKGQA